MSLEEWAKKNSSYIHDGCIEFPWQPVADICAERMNQDGCDVQVIEGVDEDGVRYWAVTENFPKEI